MKNLLKFCEIAFAERVNLSPWKKSDQNLEKMRGIKAIKQLIFAKFRGVVFLALTCLGTEIGYGQKAWVTPSPVNPNDTITLWVDLKQCTFAGVPNILGATQPLYLWTWVPKEHPSGHPMSNGSWTASNEALKMTHAGNDVYYFKMIPTKFYEVCAAELYANDIFFLAKFKNGSNGANGYECKTEDLRVDITENVSNPTVCNTFMKKRSLSLAELVPSGGTRNFSTMTPVASATRELIVLNNGISRLSKFHWYVGH